MRSGAVRQGRYFLCGALMGAGAVLPGVSGGVLAVAFGVYRPMMELLTRPRTSLPRYWRLIPPLAAGWAVGAVVLARGVAAAMDASVTVTTWLFIGLIAGTLPSLYREAGQTGRGPDAWASFSLCALGLFAGLFWTEHVLHFQADLNGFWCAFCGALCGLSVVVPGLTTASILMALGLYQPMLEGLTRPDLSIYAVCVPAGILAALLPARAVSRLLRDHESAVYHGILGIVAASTAAMVPLRYAGAGELGLSALFCGGGFLLARWLERLDRGFRVEAGEHEEGEETP